MRAKKLFENLLFLEANDADVEILKLCTPTRRSYPDEIVKTQSTELSRLSAKVSVMQSAENRLGNDLAVFRRIDFATIRRIAAQREMAAMLVVVGRVGFQNADEMAVAIVYWSVVKRP